jgi:plasmid maintenance system antidote protein VapI
MSATALNFSPSGAFDFVIASRRSAYFGTTDSYWINLQAHYDLEMAKARVAKQAARIQPHPHDENGVLQPV